MELLFRRIGITILDAEGGDPERLIPFDVVPYIFGAAEWDELSRGLMQRVMALNAFLYDVYHDREILGAGRVSEQLILSNDSFRAEMQGFDPPQRVYTHVAALTSCAATSAIFMCCRKIAADPLACPICSRTARRCCACFPI